MRLRGSVIAWSVLKERIGWWDPGKTSIDETVTICNKIRPWNYSAVLRWAEVDGRKLTRSLVGFCVMIISRFPDIAIPIPSSAVGADAKFLVQSELRS